MNQRPAPLPGEVPGDQESWLEVLWHCLRLGVRYDEAIHTANRNRAPRRSWPEVDRGCLIPRCRQVPPGAPVT